MREPEEGADMLVPPPTEPVGEGPAAMPVSMAPAGAGLTWPGNMPVSVGPVGALIDRIDLVKREAVGPIEMPGVMTKMFVVPAFLLDMVFQGADALRPPEDEDEDEDG